MSYSIQENMKMVSYNIRGQQMKMWTRVWVCLAVWACCSSIIYTPAEAFFSSGRQESSQESDNVVGALNKIVQALDSHERHTALYERVSMLEENLNKKTENEKKLETEVLELKAKIPTLEAEIQTIPEMRKDLAEFEAKIEKLVHDYEAKLSTLASEVIRLKKNGARRKDLQTLSDGSSNVLLRIDAPICPEVALGMTAERIGDQCLYFSWGTALNWTSAHRHCQSLGGDLSAPEDLLPLKTFLHEAFARGPSIWLGASYNLDDDNDNDNNSTESKSQLNATSSVNQNQLDPKGRENEGSASLIFNLLGSGGTSNNNVHGDTDINEENQEEESNGNDLTGDIALRDEAVPPPMDQFLRDGGSLTQGLSIRDRILAPFSTANLKIKPQAIASASVVDFILLKDPMKPVEETGHLANHPSRVLSLDGTPPDGRPGSPNSRQSPGIFRDVREVILDNLGSPNSGITEQGKEETKTTGKAKMNCMLLQQKESLEYELVGMPCNEQHRFVCEILSSTNTDLKFSPDNLLHE